ncbi:GSCFA family protein [Ostertagia ostertagi]
MFETCDVFIFTLGLTETWFHAERGHTYPVCPGTAKGRYDATQHQFRNLTQAEVLTDLKRLVALVREVNPGVRFILTVSPVPLVATYSGQHVLLASSYSKCTLRSACGELAAADDGVLYFPSFEIVSHLASFGQYLQGDLRERPRPTSPGSCKPNAKNSSTTVRPAELQCLFDAGAVEADDALAAHDECRRAAGAEGFVVGQAARVALDEAFVERDGLFGHPAPRGGAPAAGLRRDHADVARSRQRRQPFTIAALHMGAPGPGRQGSQQHDDDQ